MPVALAVRAAEARDVPRLVELAHQLGYDVSAEDLSTRLRQLAEPGSAILVTCDAADRPIGWIHVTLEQTLLTPRRAQVLALVVDERQRRMGIGAGLLELAEAWAVDHACRRLLLATRVTREDAHRFYQRQGYRLLKTSHWFEKELA